MVDIFTGKIPITPDTRSRLKVTKAAQESVSSQLDPGLSDSAKRLADILDLSPEAQSKARNGLKVSGHLDFFGKVLKFLNGFSSFQKPVSAKAEVELFVQKSKLENKTAIKK